MLGRDSCDLGGWASGVGARYGCAAYRAQPVSTSADDVGDGGNGGSGSGADVGRRAAAIGGGLAAVCADDGAAESGWRVGAAPRAARGGGLSEAITPATRT